MRRICCHLSRFAVVPLTLLLLIVSTTSASSGYVGAVTVDGARGFWQMNETTGPFFSDAINGRQATAIGGISFGQDGPSSAPAAEFDGASGYAQVPYWAGTNVGGPETIEAWVSPESYQQETVIESSDSNGQSGYSLTLDPNGNPSFCVATTASAWNCAKATHSLPLQHWSYLTGVVRVFSSGYSVNLYVNGALADSQPVSGSPLPNTQGTFDIAADEASGGPADFFAGEIADVAYYPRALAASSATGHYQIMASSNQPPTPLGAITISGTATIGNLLTAQPGTWSGNNVVFSYQWQSCPNGVASACQNIAAATAATYTVAPGDAGSALRVLVTGSNSSGSFTKPSNLTSLVAAQPPVNTSLPSVVGTLDCGQSAQALPGSWSATPPISYSYQWQYSPNGGSSWLPLAGATSTTFSIPCSLANDPLRVVVQAMNGAGSTSAASPASTPVVALPPTNTVAPVASGTAQDGQTLSTTTGGWTGAPTISYSYQWQSSADGGAIWMAIPAATNPSLALPLGTFDGDLLRAVVTGQSPYGTSSIPSNSLGPVLAQPPTNTTPPVVSGTDTQGQTLTTSNGSWTGSPTITYAYQWQTAASAAGTWSAIGGATSSTYLVSAADVTQVLRVVVTATNAAGSASVSSAATGQVTGLGPTKSAPPVITGTPEDGQTLTVTQGSWSGTAPISFSYQWQSGSSPTGPWSAIAGATGANLTLPVGGLTGSYISAVVTAQNSYGSGSATATAVGPVTAEPPSNTSVPVISGTVAEGQTLTASNGSWSGTAPFTFTYQWQFASSAAGPWSSIPSATSASYAIPFTTYTGDLLRVQVTATNGSGSAAATSAATTAIAVSAVAPINTALPVISGSVAVAQTLTATLGSWTGSPTITYAYQWQSATAAGGPWSNIGGQTSSSYLLQSSDYTHYVRVQVIATNPYGSTSASSLPAGPVAAQPPVNTTLPVISGTLAPTYTISSTTGSWGGTAPFTYSYQWQSSTNGGGSWSSISGATTSTYTVQTSDYGTMIRVVVTATGPGGSTAASSAGSQITGRVVRINGTLDDLDTSAAIVTPTGAAQTLVPLTNMTVTVKIWGASGGWGSGLIPNCNCGSWDYPGGGGGYTTATVTLNAGQSYTLVVGGAGASYARTGGYGGGGTGGAGSANYTNGGGGGYSGIFTSATLSQANALLIAGGGAGAGSTNSTTLSSLGGAGGGSAGQQLDQSVGMGYGGFGGTQTAGGARGASSSSPGGAGTALKGGNGGTYSGAGGGGYYGGGGGSGGVGSSGGGGGGSGFCRAISSVSNCSTLAGNYTDPANKSDSDRHGAGDAYTYSGGVIVVR